MSPPATKDACFPDHSQTLDQLARIRGQVDGVRKMILERRYCPEIIDQISAARASLKSVNAKILKSHLQQCLVKALEDDVDRENKIQEILRIIQNAK